MERDREWGNKELANCLLVGEMAVWVQAENSNLYLSVESVGLFPLKYSLSEHLWWEHNIMKCSNLISCGHLNSSELIHWAIPSTSLELLQGAVEPCAQGSSKCLITQVCLHCAGSRAALMLKKKHILNIFIPVISSSLLTCWFQRQNWDVQTWSSRFAWLQTAQTAASGNAQIFPNHWKYFLCSFVFNWA